MGTARFGGIILIFIKVVQGNVSCHVEGNVEYVATTANAYAMSVSTPNHLECMRRKWNRTLTN